MVLHNPNNWHWVNKDVAPWAKDYLETNLKGLSAEEGDVSVTVDKVLSMDGDVDVSQRKGKVITLFDVKLVLEYSGQTASIKDIKGTITVPEVAHDTEEDEYVFDIEIHSPDSSKQPVKDVVRKKILPPLRKQLAQLGPAIIAEHGRDLQHGPNSSASADAAASHHTSSANSSAGNKPAVAGATKASTSNERTSTANVTVVTDTAEFQTTAAELFQTFTNPQRIAAFTRSPPKLFEGAQQGDKFEIFGGNVSGEFVELSEPTTIVQRWRLTQWPSGHYSTLRITFDQNDQDAVTVMRVRWDGVPVGQEEVTKRNWGEYYVVRVILTFVLISVVDANFNLGS